MSDPHPDPRGEGRGEGASWHRSGDIMKDCRIGVVGAAGRMGRLLLRLAATTPGFRLVAGSERQGLARSRQRSRRARRDRAPGPDPRRRGRRRSSPRPMRCSISRPPRQRLAHAKLAAASGKAHVIGTTGIDAAGRKALAEAAPRRRPSSLPPNMSLGVNLLAELVTQVARSLDPAWDIEIVEMHHRHKVDAPSGTALLFGRAAAAGRSVDLDEVGRSRPRRHHRRAQDRRHRLRGAARRRCGGRA